jgi:hypothetical protein
MRAFADPLPKPERWSHIDVYPHFSVWNWEVETNRRRPGFTVLENVSKTGFRSVVREWLPSGTVLADVKVSVASAKLYVPGSRNSVNYLRLRDGKLRHAIQRADASGRLSFDLDGEAYEVGVGAAPEIVVAGWELDGANWASPKMPVRLRLRFVNRGGSPSRETSVKWESPNSGVRFSTPLARLYSLNPGEFATVQLEFTVADAEREVVAIEGVEGTRRVRFTVPLYPAAPVTKDFQIADGRKVKLWTHATEASEETLGEGNADGHAAPGERFAVLFPDGDALRAAELFTNDACVDNTVRASDPWDAYDHVGASAKYSLPLIRADCEPGHVLHLLARVLVPDKPNHHVRYAAIEIPVWYRTAGR